VVGSAFVFIDTLSQSGQNFLQLDGALFYQGPIPPLHYGCQAG
jgi:hypothetical protein